MKRLPYKKQRIYCVSLMRKSKKKTILWLNVSRITSNKNLWMVVKLTFPPKIVGINRVILRDSRKIISDTEKVALQSFL